MELVEGTPLRGPLPLKQALEYAGQILDALHAVHRKGITHRDLKPANILVTKQGVKLLDFGLAKRSGPLQESDDTLTAALNGKGEILGTLQYISAEQLHGKEADARSDLFSFSRKRQNRSFSAAPRRRRGRLLPGTENASWPFWSAR
jgi:serine/threonine protein kinase